MMKPASFRRRAVASAIAMTSLLGGAAVLLKGEDGDTVVVVVRHSEKGPKAQDDRHTPLSPEGANRAAALAHAVSAMGVEVIYTSDYLRTKQTVQPLADARKIEAREHTNVDDLVKEIRSQHRGKVVLIAGHSNTVPEIVAKLGGGDIRPIEDRQYDDLFVVVLRPPGASRLLHLKFGLPTP